MRRPTLRPRLHGLALVWDYLLGERPTFHRRKGHPSRLTLEALEAREVPTVSVTAVKEDFQVHQGTYQVLGNVLANDPVSGGNGTVQVQGHLDTNATVGTLGFNSWGASVNYHPTQGSIGTDGALTGASLSPDSFSYHDTVKVGNVTYTSETVTDNITVQDNAPSAGTSVLVFGTGVNKTLQVSLSQLLSAAGATDADSDPIGPVLADESATNTTLPTDEGGTAWLNWYTGFSYRPPSQTFQGWDSFQVRFWDKALFSSAVTIKIQVGSASSPTLGSPTFSTPLDAPASGSLQSSASTSGGPPLTYAAQANAATAAGGTVTVNSDGSYTYTPKAGYVGSDSFAFRASTAAGWSGGGTAAVTVTLAPTATAVTAAAPNPSAFGQAVTLTAQVTTSDSYAGTPTGTVNFYDNGTLLANETLDGSGAATAVTGAAGVATLAVGSHAITARYAATSTFAGSSSVGGSTQVVNKAATATTLSPAPATAVYGQAVTLTATVAVTNPGSGTPTGTITFYDNGVALGNAALAGAAGGPWTATLTTTALTAANHANLTAGYGGDANFSSTTSPAKAVNVGKAATALTLTTDTPNPVANQAVTLTAAVAVQAPGAGTPTGNVQFKDGATLLGTVALPANGRATLPAVTLKLGYHNVTATYVGDNNFATSTGTIGLRVVRGAAPPAFQPASPCTCGCPTTDAISMLSDGSALGVPDANSLAPVRYADGTVKIDSFDLSADGVGPAWGQSRSWSNGAGYANAGDNGAGWIDSQDPRLVEASGTALLAVVADGQTAWFFARQSDGTYAEQTAGPEGLTYDSAADVYTFSDGAGDRTAFDGFSSARPAGQAGQFASFTDAAGTAVAVTAWTAAGRMAEARAAANGVTDSYLYGYVGSGANAGLLASVALRRSLDGGATWAAVRSVAYSYYDGSQVGGNPGDLMSATVEDPTGAAISTDYYRYYLPDEAGGYGGGLKYVVTGASFARLQTAAAAAGATAFTAADSTVALYADNFFQYDSQGRATAEVASGAGCSVCSNGQGTFTYAYASSGNAAGPNSWATKMVEGMPDGNATTVYTNSLGEVLLSAYADTTTGQQWLTYYRYDAQGRCVLSAGPSAVTGLDEALPDLVGYGNATETFLRASGAPVTAYSYGTATTATDATAGDVAGYPKEVDLLNGVGGTPVPQSVTLYTSHSAGGATVYRAAAATAFRNADGTGAETTATAYSYFAGTNRVQSATTTPPAVTAAENGPGTAASTAVVYNAQGQAIWSKDAAGYLTYAAYDPATGAAVETIADVDATQTGEFVGLPAGWATPAGGGLNLVTTYTVDSLGRTTKEVDPNGRTSYAAYDDANHQVRAYAGWNAATNAPSGPTAVTRQDWANGYTETFTMTAAPAVDGSGAPTGTEAISGLQSLTRTYVNNAGQVVRSDAYFDLSGLTYSTGPMGTAGANYYETLYAYDHDGKLDKTVSPSGTIYRTVSDGQGRALSTWVGTHDTPTAGYWSPTNLAGTDMAETAAFVYDGGGVGDSNLTRVTRFTGSTAAPDMVTQYAYDWRDRQVGRKDGVTSTEADGAHRPITATTFDNLNEATQAQVFDGDGLSLVDGNGTLQVPASSLLRGQGSASYDEWGQVYRTTLYSVDPTTGNVTGNLASNAWYDSRGNVIETSAPNGPVTKNAYDGAGRLTLQYATDGAGGTGYAAASSVGNDTVLSQVGYGYDADGNVILTTSGDRLPNATGTGALGNATSGVYARVSYAAAYYDAGDRLVASVDVGTNGGATWTRPASVPTGSDTVLLSGMTYGADGGVQDATDPRGVVTRTLRDALGRTTETIEDYGTGLKDKTTLYAYGPAGMTSLTAADPATGNQTTAWAYGVTTATGSTIDSNDIVGATEHPDPTTGNASTSLEDAVTVDAQGRTLTRTDRNGTTHSYSYDSLGRVTADAATALGTGIDGAVRKIGTAYDGQGNAYLTTSYDGTGAVVNQVERLYNGFGQLTEEYQAASGAVNTSTTPAVQYTYATSGNTDRLTGIVYPDGHALNYNYASGVDAAISRLSNITDGTGTLEGYTYMGLATVVERNHPESNADLSYLTVGSTGDAGDEVTGLDRFGRVVDQKWADGNTTLSEYKYGYDRGGNALYKQDAVNGNFSQLFSYDDLNQLAGYQEGTLNANLTGLAGNATANQSWGYDALGNWQTVTTNGTTQARTANAQNEYTAVGNAAPAYNAAGDMITDETGKQFVYDAWNRLVAVKSAGNVTLETNGYDGTNRRDTTTAGGTTTDLLYSAAWQVLEEQVSGNYTQRYDWSPIYVDALIARDSDGSGTGLTAAGGNFTRLWPMQDANWNAVALADGTGAVVERYDYTPFGVVTIYSPDYGTVRTTSLYSWTQGFQGMWRDLATTMYASFTRWYSPSLGRWIQSDPLELRPDLNEYRSDSNDPGGVVDPLGLQGNGPALTFDTPIDPAWSNQHLPSQVPQNAGPSTAFTLGKPTLLYKQWEENGQRYSLWVIRHGDFGSAGGDSRGWTDGKYNYVVPKTFLPNGPIKPPAVSEDRRQTCPPMDGLKNEGFAFPPGTFSPKPEVQHNWEADEMEWFKGAIYTPPFFNFEAPSTTLFPNGQLFIGPEFGRRWDPITGEVYIGGIQGGIRFGAPPYRR